MSKAPVLLETFGLAHCGMFYTCREASVWVFYRGHMVLVTLTHPSASANWSTPSGPQNHLIGQSVWYTFTGASVCSMSLVFPSSRSLAKQWGVISKFDITVKILLGYLFYVYSIVLWVYLCMFISVYDMWVSAYDADDTGKLLDIE